MEPIDGAVCYRVVLTPKEGQPETRYYDKKTSLLVRTNMIMKTEMGEIPAEMSVSDYPQRYWKASRLRFYCSRKFWGRSSR